MVEVLRKRSRWVFRRPNTVAGLTAENIALLIVQADTVVCWHKRAFKLYYQSGGSGWGSIKKHRWDVQFRIEHAHPLNSLNCLVPEDFIVYTNGARPDEHVTIYYLRGTIVWPAFLGSAGHIIPARR